MIFANRALRRLDKRGEAVELIVRVTQVEVFRAVWTFDGDLAGRTGWDIGAFQSDHLLYRPAEGIYHVRFLFAMSNSCLL